MYRWALHTKISLYVMGGISSLDGKIFSAYSDSEDRFKWPLKYCFLKCTEDICQTAITHTRNIVSEERTNHLHIRKIINQWVAYSIM